MIKEEYEVLDDLEGKYWWFLGRTKIAFSVLEKYLKKKNSKILDAGCGTGKNMEYLKKYGDVYGLDLSKDALEFCKKKGFKNLKKGSVEKLPFKDNTFDLVTCFGVLYHKGVKDDLKAVKELSRVCKKGGLVLITTPATEFLAKPFWLSPHDISQQTGRRHSKRGINELFKRSGVKTLEITYMNTLLMPAIMGVRLVKKIKESIIPSKEFKSELQMPHKLINKGLKGILSFEQSMIKAFPLPFGLTIVGIGRKK